MYRFRPPTKWMIFPRLLFSGLACNHLHRLTAVRLPKRYTTGFPIKTLSLSLSLLPQYSLVGCEMDSGTIKYPNHQRNLLTTEEKVKPIRLVTQ